MPFGDFGLAILDFGFAICDFGFWIGDFGFTLEVTLFNDAKVISNLALN
jgi:hypothetical protein